MIFSSIRRTFASTARTGVAFEGQGKSRVVAAIPSPEEPTRLMGQLARLARCAVALHEVKVAAFAASCAVDSIPLARIRALRTVAAMPNGARVAECTEPSDGATAGPRCGEPGSSA